MTRLIVPAALVAVTLGYAVPAGAQQAGAAGTEAAPAPEVHAPIPVGVGPDAAVPDPAEAQRVADLALRRALTLAARGDWVFAQAEGEAAGDIGADVIDWMRLRAGQGSFADDRDFVSRHPDWPGVELVRRRAEDKLASVPPAEVIAWFARTRPMSPGGAVALIAALDATGQGAEADRTAREIWRTMSFSVSQQDTFLAAYGARVAADHAARLRILLDRGDLDQAGRMLGLVDTDLRTLAAARIALARRAPGVDALVLAVPAGLQADPGLMRDRALWRWRMGQEDGAADLVLQASDDAESLGDPAAWAGLRGQLARFSLRKGDAATAYKLAARHRMEPGGEDWADLEWLAGYAALKLGDGPTALGHFERLVANVKSPISAARAAYWQGRALADLGLPVEAKAAWRRGAAWQTAFYGLLCAEKAGLPLDPEFLWPPSLPDWHGSPFVTSSLFRAADALYRVDAGDQARRFVMQIALTRGDDRIPALAAMAEERGDAKLALMLAKRAALSGEVLVRPYYPLPDLPTGDLAVPEELALSIARRESEFDPAAVSQVGALGLMQLMPTTAQLMAPEVGETFDRTRLTQDPAYNIRLGSAYLARLRAEFGTSPVLVAVGYNAGPARARAWIAQMGDPRLPETDIVDWIEMIPYAETRNYVMRVAESLPVYRARLGIDVPGPLRFTEELRGSPPVSPPEPEAATPPADSPATDGPEAAPAPADAAPPVVPPGAGPSAAPAP